MFEHFEEIKIYVVALVPTSVNTSFLLRITLIYSDYPSSTGGGSGFALEYGYTNPIYPN